MTAPLRVGRGKSIQPFAVGALSDSEMDPGTYLLCLWNVGRATVFLAGFPQLSLLPPPAELTGQTQRQFSFYFSDLSQGPVCLSPNSSSSSVPACYPHELTHCTTGSCLKPGQRIPWLTLTSSSTGV